MNVKEIEANDDELKAINRELDPIKTELDREDLSDEDRFSLYIKQRKLFARYEKRRYEIFGGYDGDEYAKLYRNICREHGIEKKAYREDYETWEEVHWEIKEFEMAVMDRFLTAIGFKPKTAAASEKIDLAKAGIELMYSNMVGIDRGIKRASEELASMRRNAGDLLKAVKDIESQHIKTAD